MNYLKCPDMFFTAILFRLVPKMVAAPNSGYESPTS